MQNPALDGTEVELFNFFSKPYRAPSPLIFATDVQYFYIVILYSNGFLGLKFFSGS